MPVRGGLSVVGFFDTGNVFSGSVRLNLAEFRSAVGFGVRYRSPFGPLRVDLGFKTHRRDVHVHGRGRRAPMRGEHGPRCTSASARHSDEIGL